MKQRKIANVSKEDDDEDMQIKGLDTQIEMYTAELKQQDAATTEDPRKMLRKYFTDKEMSVLWNRLQRKIKSQGTGDTKQKWQDLAKLKKGEGKNVVKSKALSLNLAFPEKWQDMWVKEVERITQTDEKQTVKEELTRGELQQRHGFAEANRLIEKGKWEATVDSDGDEVFVKSSKKRTHTMSHSRMAELNNRHQLVDEDQALKIRDAMMSFFDKAPGIVHKRPAMADKVRKRPASLSWESMLGNEADAQTDEDPQQSDADKPPELTKMQKLALERENAKNKMQQQRQPHQHLVG